MSRAVASRARTCLAAALVALAVGACRRAPERLEASKEVLATLPGTYRRGSIAVARDGRTVAFVDARADGVRVVVDGAPGPVFADAVTPKVAPGGRVGYWATDSKAVDPPPVLLVVGDRPQPTDLVRPGTLVLSPDGTRWAAAGGLRGAGGARGPTVVWVDGNEAGRYADATAPSFGPDGRHVAWLAEEHDGRVAVMVDGTVRRRIDEPGPEVAPAMKLQDAGPTLEPHMVLRWLPDSSLLVLAPGPDGWALARDERRLGTWSQARMERSGNLMFGFGDRFAGAPAIASGSVSVAEAAPVVAWWERLEGQAERWRVVRDGKPADDVVCHAYLESQPPPTLSRDGRHLAYGCHLGADQSTPQAIAVCDGERFGPYWAVYGVAVAPDGTVAFAASDDPPTTYPQRWRYRVDGTARGPVALEVWRPRLDTEGERLAWEAIPAKRPHLGLDAVPIASFDDVFWGPEFVEPHRVAWVIRRGRKLARVTVAF